MTIHLVIVSDSVETPHEAAVVPPQGLPDGRRAAACAGRRVKRGRHLEYPEAGYFRFVEEPVRFGRDVTAFIAGR
jgi:hypothetical protein